MAKYFSNGDALVDISIEHQPHQVDAGITHNIRYSEIMVHDLVDRVEGIFFVNYGIEKNTKCPDILLFASVGLAG